MSRPASVSVALGSPCLAFHCASVTGVVKSDGSTTMRVVLKSHPPPRTQIVGATCQPHSTRHQGSFTELTLRSPSIHTFAGSRPSATMSRHISLARAQQPSSGYLNGMHGTGTVRGSQLVAAIAWKIARAGTVLGTCHQTPGT